MINLCIRSTHRADLGHLEPLRAEAEADPRFHISDTIRMEGPWVDFYQGDRTELLEACAESIRDGNIICHAAGGEVTKGSTDNAVRDAITKLAHLHYPVHEAAAKRIRDLGEAAWRIRVVGEIGHDADMTKGICPVPAKPGDLVVAYHPVTARPEETRKGLDFITRHCEFWHGAIWLTEPNGDPGSDHITQRWRELASCFPNVQLLSSLGHKGFRALIRTAGTLMGNSSAILTEVPLVGAYPILIGTRQEGRQMSNLEPGACKLILDDIADKLMNPEIRIK